MELFKKYRRKQIAELRNLEAAEIKAVVKNKGISVSDEDMKLSDKDFALGKIARNPLNHADQWYINAPYVNNNFEEL
jgi:hypothetical protein